MRASTSSTSAPFAGRSARGGFSYLFGRGGAVFGGDSEVSFALTLSLSKGVGWRGFDKLSLSAGGGGLTARSLPPLRLG